MKKWMLYMNDTCLDVESPRFDVKQFRALALKFLCEVREIDLDMLNQDSVSVKVPEWGTYTTKYEVIEERKGEPDPREGVFECRNERKMESGWREWRVGNPSPKLAAFLTHDGGDGIQLLPSNTQWRYVPPKEQRKSEETKKE